MTQLQGEAALAAAIAQSNGMKDQIKAQTVASPESSEINAITKSIESKFPNAKPPGMNKLPQLPQNAQLGLPVIPNMPVPAPMPAYTPLSEQAATTLPEMRVEREKPNKQTWHTTLAPSIIPKQTNFNYKRVQLPEVIYSDAYNAENSHLPVRVTREQYEALLFVTAEKNDINGTRALINAGTSLNTTNDEGESPLAAANRAGAIEVAALLTARGAK